MIKATVILAALGLVSFVAYRLYMISYTGANPFQ